MRPTPPALTVYVACIAVAAVLVLGALAVSAIGRAIDAELRCSDAASVASGQCEPTP